jgi:hypothetical protein
MVDDPKRKEKVMWIPGFQGMERQGGTKVWLAFH